MIVLQILPMVIEIIKAIEQAIPDKGRGSEKQAMLNTMVEQAVMADPCVSNDIIPELMPAVESVTKTIVKTFNDTGVFETTNVDKERGDASQC
jgi:hypothetical protein